MEHFWEYLKLLSAGGSLAPRHMSTITIAKKLGVSQQTVSRVLIDMERKGIITRKVSNTGIEIGLTSEGIKILRSNHQWLQAIFDRKIPGIIKSGIGEGAYYVKKYMPAIKKVLDIKPYPGTLNVVIDPDSMKLILSMEAIILQTFKTDGRMFGDVFCYYATIRTNHKSTKGAVLVPKLTHHQNTIEFIAPVDVRKRLKLHDGDSVTVEFE